MVPCFLPFGVVRSLLLPGLTLALDEAKAPLRIEELHGAGLVASERSDVHRDRDRAIGRYRAHDVDMKRTWTQEQETLFLLYMSLASKSVVL